MSVDLPGIGPETVRVDSDRRPREGTGADDSVREIRSVARAFEGLLLQMLVSEMRKAQVPGGLFGEGAGSHVYEGMFDQFLAEHLSGAAPLGIADLLEEQWTRDLDGVARAREALREARDARAREAYGEAAAAPIDPNSKNFKDLTPQVPAPASDTTVGWNGSQDTDPSRPSRRRTGP